MKDDEAISNIGRDCFVPITLGCGNNTLNQNRIVPLLSTLDISVVKGYYNNSYCMVRRYRDGGLCYAYYFN